MRKRWMILAEIFLMIALLVWVGFYLFNKDTPPGGVEMKVQLPGAADQVFLVPGEGGKYYFQLRAADGSIQLVSPDGFADRVYRGGKSRTLLQRICNVTSPLGLVWITVGLLGQVLFTGRMVVQWLVSEKHKKSVVPPIFWWMSLIGASMLMVYFLWRKDPVGVLGQSVGWFIYIRNLWMIHRKPRSVEVTDDPAPEAELGK